MCTVSWLRTDSGYEVFCNRDERHARLPALPPRIHENRGMRFIAPVDGNAGGTWIAVNECGITLCLLNQYGDESAVSGKDFISRGRLVTEMADSATLQQLEQRFARLRLTTWQPFMLVALQFNKAAKLFLWNGQTLRKREIADQAYLLSSSSFDQAGVHQVRRKQFDKLRARADGISREMLRRFHRDHLDEPSAWSPCMHRSDAQTVSFSHLRVRDDAAEFFYLPHAPCKGETGLIHQKILLSGKFSLRCCL